MGSPNDKDTLFKPLAAEESGIAFSNDLSPDEKFNIIEYLYFYNGGGIAVGDVNNDGLPDLYFTANQKSNALYLNKGGLQFEEVTEQAGVAGLSGWSTGVTMADVNADGWLDIYVCHLGDYKGITGHNELFINQQDGTFRESAAEYGLDFKGFATQAAFFDYDLDGDLDCYLLNHSVHSTENYGNAEIRLERDSLAGDRLMRNEGPGKPFRDVSAKAGIYGSRVGYGLGIATGDLNNDGCTDLYISNDFHENDYLYYNNCDGTFREVIEGAMGYSSTFSMGNDMADFDNDGRLDLISLDMKPADQVVHKRSVGADPYNIYQFKLSFGYYYQFPRNMLQWNRGNLFGEDASFSEIGQLAGVDATDWSWSPLFCDLDGDGHKDLFISNGIWQRPNDLDYLKYSSNRKIQSEATDAEMAKLMPSGEVSNFAFRNAKNLSFSNVTEAWGLQEVGASTGAAFCDLDRDGDIDLVINNLNAPATIFENRSAGEEGPHFLRVKLVGEKGNPSGIGARVSIRTSDGMQVQEAFTTRGFLSAGEAVLTFGLGSVQKVDELEVRWPGGKHTRLYNLNANSEILVEEAAIHPEKEVEELIAAPMFESLARDQIPDFRHREDEYVDFDTELLMPHMISKKGPRMAVGDVNGDGREDVFICGARDQAGALYFQLENGSFARQEIRMDTGSEGVDAAFFDADHDGDLDLYIVNGGGEVFMLPERRRDELWINDGSGHFSNASDRLPAEMRADGACVVPLDFDEDGFMDLFVGSRAVPGYYGVLPESYLLRNNGQGTFEHVTEDLASELRHLGLVTDACLITDGGEQQLAVVGEWMPLTIFSNLKGKWTKTTVAGSEGWWNTVHPSDIDNDGDTDLLLGNLGFNAELKASTSEPVELFVKDFDNNRKVDPILTYYKNGERHAFASFNELSMQLTQLRKESQSYEEFANKPVEEIFPPSMLKGSMHLQATTFASGIMENDNGRFNFKPFPREWQLSPIYAFATADFNRDKQQDILAVGNFYESIPALGRYDASYGFLLLSNEAGFEDIEPARSGFIVPGQARDLSLLSNTGKLRILVARNDEPVLGFEVKDDILEQ